MSGHHGYYNVQLDSGEIKTCRADAFVAVDSHGNDCNPSSPSGRGGGRSSGRGRGRGRGESGGGGGEESSEDSSAALVGRTRSLVAVEAERARGGTGQGIAQWVTESEQDPTEYVGKRVREYFYTVNATEDQTPYAIAKAAGVDVSALLLFNQRRWFPGLTQNSKLRAGTKVLVPTMPENLVVAATPTQPNDPASQAAEEDQEASLLTTSKERAAAAAAERERHGHNGIVSATNFLNWRVDYENGERVELDEVDVRRASWLFRCHDEGWISTAGAGEGYVGRRLQIQRDVDTMAPYYTLATVVGYLPQGEDEEDFEMW